MKLLAITIGSCTAATLIFSAWMFRYDIEPIGGLKGAYVADRWTGRVEVWLGLSRAGELQAE